jgi:hypothetical protein
VGLLGRPTRIRIALLAAYLACGQEVVSQEDDTGLDLEKVKTMQVSAGLIAHQEVGLSLETLKEPFKAVLQKRGVRVDLNDYDHVVSTSCEIARTTSGNTTSYAVRVSSHYREGCTANRIKLAIDCPLWETLDLIRIFQSPQEARQYVIKAVSEQAGEFEQQFGSR